MKKRIIIILIAVLVVLLSAIAVIEIVGSKNADSNNDPSQGLDEVYVNSGTGVLVDLETGSVISEIDVTNPDNKKESYSGDGGASVSDTSNNQSTPVEIVGEAGGSISDTPKEDLYTVKGIVVVDGKPLANTDLELHSKIKTSKTDKDGKFVFNDVELGKHTLTVLKNGKKIGNMSFELKKDNKTAVSSSDKGSYILSVDKNSGGLELELVLNEKKGTLKPTEAEKVEKPNTDSDTDDNSGNETDSGSSDISSDTSSDNTSSVNSNTNPAAMQGYMPWR